MNLFDLGLVTHHSFDLIEDRIVESAPYLPKQNVASYIKEQLILHSHTQRKTF